MENEQNQSYAHLKNYFNGAMQDGTGIATEAGKLGYGMGATNNSILNKEEVTKWFKQGLTNLTAAVQEGNNQQQ